MRTARPLLSLTLLLALGACTSDPEPSGERALERVAHQVAAGPRIPGTPGHAATRDWIASELARLGGRVERQTFVDSTLGRPLELSNLIGRFGSGSGRRIVLCAHYDTRPWCDEDPDPARRDDPLPGANDAGSGVAVLLEIAEMMHRKAPPVGVDLVFFDGEDQGRTGFPGEYCLGAQGYARRLPARGDDQRPVAAFLFDMVGDRDLRIVREENSAARASNLVEMIQAGARATGARHFVEGQGPVLVDDHIPLLDAGLPAADIIDFEYAAWHTHRDLPDQVSAASLAEVSRVAAWLVYRSPLTRH